MVRALFGTGDSGFSMYSSDLKYGDDFLNKNGSEIYPFMWDAIVTNPPYGSEGPKIVKHALDLACSVKGFVAMLLPVGWDSAPGRKFMFEKEPAFDKELVITKRIVWVDKPGAAPMGHHSWFIWDFQRNQTFPPTKHYVG